MPSSLRFVLLLLGLATLAAPVSVFTIYHQDSRQADVTAEQITGGKVAAGKLAIDRFGCISCHQIGTGSGTEGRVDPSLNGVAVRATIAGRLANRPDQMVLWLRHPQAVVPGNAMPDQGIGEPDARDIAPTSTRCASRRGSRRVCGFARPRR